MDSWKSAANDACISGMHAPHGLSGMLQRLYPLTDPHGGEVVIPPRRASSACACWLARMPAWWVYSERWSVAAVLEMMEEAVSPTVPVGRATVRVSVRIRNP